MSNLDNVNGAFSAAIYKKLHKQIIPLAEKLTQLEEYTHLIETTPGPRGHKGINGDQGIAGRDGKKGLIGEQGPQGVQGPKGDKGIKGDQGIAGRDGKEGLIGKTGPQGIQGPKGDIGPQGQRGANGVNGIQGPQGDAGPRGDVGATGTKGDTGPQGIKGDKGDQGIQGVKGDTGERGEIGKTGPQGVQGEIGPKGEAGRDGNDGKDAELPDIDKIIEPHFIKAKKELDSYVLKSDKDFNNWKSIVNKQISNIGGGGAIKISQLTDVQQSTAKVDGQFLKYDGTLKKWVGGTVDLNSIIGASPETLDTLVELAAAINNDDDFATTIADNIALKADQTDLDAHTADTNNPHSVTATQVGLGNVTNESKATMFTNPSFTGDASLSGGNLQIGSTPAYSYDRSIKLHDNGVQFGARVSLIGTNDDAGPGLEMVTDGSLSKRTIIRHEGEGSNDYGLSFFTTNNGTVSEKVRFDGNGNVGIGTTSPTEKLEVSGDLMLQQNGVIKNKNNSTQFRFGLNDLYLDAGHVRAGYSVGIRGQRGSTKGMEQGSTLNSDLGIYCGGNEAISIHSDGDTLVNNDLEVEGTTTVGKITLSDNSFVTETADFTMGETHRGATVLLQNTGPITITVPSQVAGHTTTFIAETSNSVVFTSGTGLSAFNSFNSANQIAGIFGQAQIIFKSSTEAFLGGNVV